MSVNSMNMRGGRGLYHLSSTFIINRYLPHFDQQVSSVGTPKRKSCDPPRDNGCFVKALKASCLKDKRLMPGTKIMLAVLAGWAGRNTSISTTMSIIGDHLGRSRRQIFRYLKDAEEHGYLVYSRTKDRIGYITGIKVWLNFGAIRHYYENFLTKKRAEYRRNKDVTDKSHIKFNSILEEHKDPIIDQALVRFANLLGYEYEPERGFG